MEAPERRAGYVGRTEGRSVGGGGGESSLEQPWAVAEAARGDSAPPLVDVAQFRRDWQRILAPSSPRVDHLHLLGDDPLHDLDGSGIVAHDMIGDDAEEGLVPLPDLSCDDIFIGTSHQQIHAAIQTELAKEENKGLSAKGLLVNSGSATLMMRASVPNAARLAADKQLARATLLSLREKDEAEAQAKKRKEVNYLTPNMLIVDAPMEPIDFDEVILTVSIYHHKKQAKIQEFLVFGSQKLTALRDKITCVSDLLPEPNSRSGYFFFENMFYDDMRHPANIRYSKTVIDWTNAKKEEELKQQAKDLGKPASDSPLLQQYTAANMEDTAWEDLKVRIGVPYLYCHQGECEHRVIITDIRLVTKEDEKNKNAYPLQTFQSKIRRKKCVICDIYPASYLTYNDELGPQNPCFFCEKCYAPFHYAYDSRGTLLLNHDVFKYHHE